MAQAPTEVVLEVEVTSCLTGGEGPSPALSPPPPCEGRSSNSGAQVAPRPWGINLSLSHEETEIPPPCAPGQHTPTPPQPHRGHRCLFPNPLESDRDGDPSAQEPELGSQGDALQPAVLRPRRQVGAPSEGTKAEPSVLPGGPVCLHRHPQPLHFSQGRFLSLLSQCDRCSGQEVGKQGETASSQPALSC